MNRELTTSRAVLQFYPRGKGGFLQTPTNGRIKERRNASADAPGKPMYCASAHLIASSWTSANTFRRSFSYAYGPISLNLSRMPEGLNCVRKDETSMPP